MGELDRPARPRRRAAFSSGFRPVGAGESDRTPAVTNAEYTAAIARAVRRPALLSVPAPALRLLLGEMAQLLLVSQRVIPRRLLDAGFTFGYPDVESAVRELVASGS